MSGQIHLAPPCNKMSATILQPHEMRQWELMREAVDALVGPNTYQEQPEPPDTTLHFPGGDFDRTYWLAILNTARKSAIKKSIPFALSIDALYDLAKTTRGFCSVSGLPFSYNRIGTSPRRPFIPSIDRITNSQGYTLANVRLVCACVNIAMSDWGEQVLWEIARSMRELYPVAFGGR